MRKVLTSKDKRDILQPLDKNGYVNEHFNRIYGEKNNPYVGTERDSRMGRNATDSRTGLTKDKAKKVEEGRKRAEKNSWENIK